PEHRSREGPAEARAGRPDRPAKRRRHETAFPGAFRPGGPGGLATPARHAGLRRGPGAHRHHGAAGTAMLNTLFAPAHWLLARLHFLAALLAGCALIVAPTAVALFARDALPGAALHLVAGA